MKFVKGSRTFAIRDSGSSGYTTLTPTTVVGATEALRIASGQAGTRLIYVSNAGSDSTGALYFWDGTNIIDQLGSTTGVGGVAYGTDPLNPSGPILPYRYAANVLPRDSAAADIGSTTSTRIGAASMPSAFRANKPDWFLFKRGDTLSMYEDLRAWMDGKGLATTATWSSHTLRSAGGTSTSARAVVGVYGPASAGRVRVIHPVGGFVISVGSANYKNSVTFGFHFDGTDRDLAIRPVDWATFPMDESGNSAMQVSPSSSAITDNIYEDIHWQGCALEHNLQWGASYLTPAATRDIDLYRCLITDFWSDGQTVRILASRASGDAAQTFAANTTTTLTYVTETTDTSAMFVHTTGIATVIAGYTGAGVSTTYFTKMQVLSDVTAVVAADGTVELVLLIDGVASGASISVPGTGTGSATYQLHGWFRLDGVGRAGLVTGNTFEVAVKTTNATGTISVGATRFVNVPLLSPKISGLYAQVTTGARFRMRECILSRNGFNANPLIQAGILPSGTSKRYDYNILNHNIYSVGDCPASQFELYDNVFLVGGAGEVVRNRAIYERNFFYSGYAQTVPEHNSTTYVTDVSTFNDNVIQKFKATGTITTAAHPGWGYLATSGLVGHQIRRNIISEVHYTGEWCLVLSCVGTPYEIPLQMLFVNHTENTDVRGNIFDQASTAANKATIEEANGANRLCCNFMRTITATPSVAAGNVATVTLQAGYTGTPSYQWIRYASGTSTEIVIAGETNSTYTLTASDVSGTSLLCAVRVSGIQYPPGTGIKGTVYTDNIFIRPSGNFNRIYYNVNQFSGGSIPTVTTPPPSSSYSSSVELSAPCDSTTAKSSLSYSDSVEVNSTNYDDRAAAASALGWPNVNASLKTALQAAYITVSTSDGFSEYLSTVVGATPMTTAMRRDYWDSRFTGKYLGNHVRAGRGMATVY